MAIPRLMAITDADTRRQTEGDFESWLTRWVEAGVDTVQIREKDDSSRQLFDKTQRAVEAFGERLAILINGRADIAVAAGAQGVHLPAQGLPAAAIRERFGDELTLGASTHSLEEIRQAALAGVDYVTFSPIFPTPSKARYGPSQGLAALRAAAELGLPVIALGGIQPDDLEDVSVAGAVGVAAIRAFHDTQTLAEVVAHYHRMPRVRIS